MNDEALPLEMRRLIDQENKQILSHQGEIEVISLGNNEEKKEVKVGTTLSAETKKEIIYLLHEFANVFFWFYQDTSGLNIEIVEHVCPSRQNASPFNKR